MPASALGPVTSLFLRSDGSELCLWTEPINLESVNCPANFFFMLLLKHLLVKNYYTRGGEAFLRTRG